MAQPLTQTIRGTVADRDSHRELAGASVFLADDSMHHDVMANESGIFVLTKVPVGRRSIHCSFSGYEYLITDYLVVSSAKGVNLVIELVHHYVQQPVIVIKAPGNPKLPVNKLSVVSTCSFTPEETQRYAANVNDHSRMVPIISVTERRISLLPVGMSILQYARKLTPRMMFTAGCAPFLIFFYEIFVPANKLFYFRNLQQVGR